MYLKAPVLEHDSGENLIPRQFRISLKPSAAEPIDVSSAEPIVDRLLTKLGVLQITLTVLASPELQAAIKLLVQEFEAELKSLAHILQRTIIVIPELIPWPDPEEDGCASDCIPFRHDDDDEEEEDGDGSDKTTSFCGSEYCDPAEEVGEGYGEESGVETSIERQSVMEEEEYISRNGER